MYSPVPCEYVLVLCLLLGGYSSEEAKWLRAQLWFSDRLGLETLAPYLPVLGLGKSLNKTTKLQLVSQ